MRRGTFYLLSFVLLVLVLAATVGACGSDDGATTTSAAAITTSETSPATPGSTPDTTAPASTETTVAAKPIELKMATLHQPTSLPDLALVAWAERIEQASNGLLTIRNYNANQLLSGPEIHDGLKAGVADLGCSYVFASKPGFEVSANLAQLIRGVSLSDGVRIFDALWAEYTDVMESQWEDVKLLWIIPALPTFIFTVEQPVRMMEDMKGLEIRVPNAINADCIKALGAAPISMPAPDWITSLDKGMTDGGLSTLTNMPDFQIGEKFKYATIFPLGNAINFLAMRKDVWDSLSPDWQKIIDDSLADARQEAIDAWAQVEAEAQAYCEEKGIEFIELAPDEMARWNETISPVFDKLGADMDALGYPGTELVDFALSLTR